MANEIIPYDEPIGRQTDWGGDASTDYRPVSGRRVQEFIKKELNARIELPEESGEKGDVLTIGEDGKPVWGSGSAEIAERAKCDAEGNVITETYAKIEQGKGLSTNDFTDEYKAQLDGLDDKFEDINDELGKKADAFEVEKELLKKFDKANIAQGAGAAEDKVMSQKATADALAEVADTAAKYTVNGKKISTDPIINGGDVKLDGYTKGGIAGAIEANDTVNTAFSKVENQIDTKGNIEDIIDALDSTETKKPLSANQGRVLNERIDAMSGLGRFLSGWDCTTGLATTNPTESPYVYPSGSFFLVAKVAEEGQTNLRPEGTRYVIGQASTSVETGNVKVGDVYKFDGTAFDLIPLDVPVIATFTNDTQGTLQGKEQEGFVEAVDGFGRVKNYDALKSAVMSSDVAEHNKEKWYEIGELCYRNGKTYRSLTKQKGVFNPATWGEYNLYADKIGRLEYDAFKANVTGSVPEFDPYMEWKEGQFVMKDGKLYQCINDHTGAWEDADFREYVMLDNLAKTQKESDNIFLSLMDTMYRGEDFAYLTQKVLEGLMKNKGYWLLWYSKDKEPSHADWTSTKQLEEENYDVWEMETEPKPTTLANFWYNNKDLLYIAAASIDSTIISLDQTFRGANRLITVECEKWDVSNVTSVAGLFQDCTSLDYIDFHGWVTNAIQHMERMFQGCTTLREVKAPNGFIVAANASGMFSLCAKLKDIDTSTWNTAAVTTMANMFYGCAALTTINVQNWNTAAVTTMANMFYGCAALTTIETPENFHIAANASYMFVGCGKLKDIDTSTWNTAAVTNMAYMFQGCAALTTINVQNWNTAAVTNMAYMFQGCAALTTINLSSFDTHKVSATRGMENIFNQCTNLRYVTLGHWFFATKLPIGFNGCPLGMDTGGDDNGWLQHVVDTAPTIRTKTGYTDLIEEEGGVWYINDGASRTLNLTSTLYDKAWATPFKTALNNKGYTIGRI